MNTKVSTFVYCLGTTNMEGDNAPINAMGVLPVLTPDFIRCWGRINKFILPQIVSTLKISHKFFF